MNSNAALKIPKEKKPLQEGNLWDFRETNEPVDKTGSLKSSKDRTGQTASLEDKDQQRGSKSGETIFESLILAQDERWRRA